MDIELMEKKLYDACVEGDVETLEALMREDKLILARLSLFSCFNQTPLHLASMLGHFEFAKSLLSYKPDFASRLDLQGCSPLHLASANGYANIVALLLQHDQKMCRVCDEDGRTPLHLAVMNGQYETVRELRKVLNYDYGQEGTVLHLCVMYNRLNIFILILESTVQDLSNILKIKDDKGDTILHSATILKRMQVIKYLVMNRREVVDVNAVNENGLTALDMIEQMPKDAKTMEIKELLVLAAGTRRAKDTTGAITTIPEEGVVDNIEGATAAAADPDDNSSKWVKTLIKKLSIFEKKQEKKDKDLLVAATVIAAMAYQAAISPPNYHEFHWDSYRFWISNTISFLASLSVIFLYVNGAGLRRKFLIWLIRLGMWITLTSMAYAYITAADTAAWAVRARTSGEFENDNYYIIFEALKVSLYSWMGLIFLSVLVVVYRFLRYLVGPLKIKIKKASKKTKKNKSEEAGVAATIPGTTNVHESITCTHL